VIQNNSLLYVILPVLPFAARRRSAHIVSMSFGKTLAFSKNVDCYRAAATWEDNYYNLVKPHNSLRLRVYDRPGHKSKPRALAMAAYLTDHVWTVKELLTSIPLRC